MFEKRDPRIDLLALALGVVVVFLSLSLMSHDAADPPVELAAPFNQIYEMKTTVYPVSGITTNACGRWGALASASLLDAFGYAAYFVVVSMAALAYMLFMRRDVDSLFLRVVGWTASLVGLTALLSMLLPWSPAGTLMGAGGHLGALGGGLLEYHFARVGGFVLASSLILGGMLLCTDYMLLRLAMVAGTLLIAMTANRRRRRMPAAKVHTRVDEPETVGGETLAMRLRGKLQASDDVDEEEEEGYEEDEYEEDDGYEEEEFEDEEEEEDVPEPTVVEAKPVTVKKPNIAKTPQTAPTVANKSLGGTSVTSTSGKPPAKVSGGSNRRRRLAALRIHQSEQEVDRDEVMDSLDAASENEGHIDYDLPSRNLLIEADDFSFENQEREVLQKAKLIDKAFRSFGYDVHVVDIEMGPVIAQYELSLPEGLRLNKITALADDLAIALRVPSVRIVSPIPGKNTVGIEVPNSERQLVRLREVMDKTNGKMKKMGIPLFLGKDVSGNPLTVDLAKLPHLLIAGRTGTGKSVCLNAIISSILMTRRPDEVRMLMIDPKMVELSGYGSLPHLMHPVVTDMRKAEAILAWAVEKMEERYALLARAGVRHMSDYNGLSREVIMERLDPQSDEERNAIPLNMPYIVIVADEMADLMMTAGKEVQTHIIRLAQKSRAVGIHLILATQKPTVDVITGLIKSNLPARIAFQVASRTDSRVVLDEMGADKLLGNGDMLFLSPGTSTLIRGQGTFLSDDEINLVVDACSTGEQNFVHELVNLKVEDEASNEVGPSKNTDELYEQAVEVVIREGRGSISLLQRALGIGYGRAARLVDFMTEDGIVGPYAGAKTRQILMTMEDWHRMKNAGGGGADAATAKAAKAELSSVSPITTRKSTTTTEPSRRSSESSSGDINDFVDGLIAADPDPPKSKVVSAARSAFAGPAGVAKTLGDDVFRDEEEDAYDEFEEEEVDEVGDETEIDAELEDEVEVEDEVDDEEYEYVDVDDESEDDEEYEYVEVDIDDGELPEGEVVDDGVVGDEVGDDEEYEYVYEDVEDEYEEEEFEDEDLEAEPA